MEEDKKPRKTGAGIVLNFDDRTDEVRFGGRSVALAGLVAGTAIAVIVPSVLAICTNDMNTPAFFFLSLFALIIGGGVAGVAAFFGSVIPAFVKSNGGKKKRKKNDDEPEEELETEEESNVSE